MVTLNVLTGHLVQNLLFVDDAKLNDVTNLSTRNTFGLKVTESVLLA